MTRVLCAVCRERERAGSLFCGACARSFDRATGSDDGTFAAVIRWSAARAVYFERRRWRLGKVAARRGQ